jgi:hypothetical protein
MVLKVELYGISLPNPNELTRYAATKRPKRVVHAVGHSFSEFLGFEVNDKISSLASFDGRRHLRSVREH